MSTVAEVAFYGARLPRHTVEVTAYTEIDDVIEIRGHLTLTRHQWNELAPALADAGFPVSQGEPTPIITGKPAT